MFYLAKTAGLDLALYQGGVVNGAREGKGVQYFPNGYKFEGEWQGNRANGPGKLEYTDGTFYEGTFKDNRFAEGILSFYTGAKFIGKFSQDERYRERFLEGSFIFGNGDMLKTTWHNGVPQSGTFVTKEGKIMKFSENEKAIFLDDEDSAKGKIIMANSTEIYEGGIKDKAVNGKGVIYSSFPHYEEAFYTAGKTNGPYICNYIQGGYCYEGNFKSGQRVGKWKYQTVNGFFYEGEANLKSGKVTFPYLNDDHFIGDVDIQFHTITLLNGTYHMMDPNGKYVSIAVQNVKSLSEIAELKDRKPNVQDILKRLKKSKVVVDEPILNGIQVYHYPDGSYFKGNFTYDFIYIHKKDLLNCYFPANGKKGSHHKPIFQLSNPFNYKREKAERLEAEAGPQRLDQSLVFGKTLNGAIYGFGKKISARKGICQGRFKDDQLDGLGRFIDPEGVVYSGLFVNGLLEGDAYVYLPNRDIIQCRFSKGVMDMERARLRKQNGLVYVGGILNFRKHGRGELTYTNGYKYIGDFKNSELDTSNALGKLVGPDGKEYDCSYTPVANRDIGILETLVDGDIYVYNQTTGSLKKAQ